MCATERERVFQKSRARSGRAAPRRSLPFPPAYAYANPRDPLTPLPAAGRATLCFLRGLHYAFKHGQPTGGVKLRAIPVQWTGGNGNGSTSNLAVYFCPSLPSTRRFAVNTPPRRGNERRSRAGELAGAPSAVRYIFDSFNLSSYRSIKIGIQTGLRIGSEFIQSVVTVIETLQKTRIRLRSNPIPLTIDYYWITLI